MPTIYFPKPTVNEGRQANWKSLGGVAIDSLPKVVSEDFGGTGYQLGVSADGRIYLSGNGNVSGISDGVTSLIGEVPAVMQLGNRFSEPKVINLRLIGKSAPSGFSISSANITENSEIATVGFYPTPNGYGPITAELTDDAGGIFQLVDNGDGSYTLLGDGTLVDYEALPEGAKYHTITVSFTDGFGRTVDFIHNIGVINDPDASFLNITMGPPPEPTVGNIVSSYISGVGEIIAGSLEPGHEWDGPSTIVSVLVNGSEVDPDYEFVNGDSVQVDIRRVTVDGSVFTGISPSVGAVLDAAVPEYFGTTDPVRLNIEGAGNTELVDFRAGFEGDIDTWEVTGSLVVTDNANGTAEIDTAAEAYSSVYVTATGPAGSLTVVRPVEIVDLTVSVLTFGSQSDASKLKIDVSSGIGAAVAFVPAGGTYTAQATVGNPLPNPNPETIESIVTGSSTSAGPAAPWDAVKPDAVRGFLVVEKVSTAGSHGYAGASIVQKAGQQLTIGIAISDKPEASTSGHKTMIGSAIGQSDIVTAYQWSGGLKGGVHTAVVPAPAEDRRIWATIQISNTAPPYWFALEGIWADADTGIAGEWEDQSGAALIIAGEPKTYYIAPETGNNANDGLTAATPKKNVIGAPPGSLIKYKGGERQRTALGWTSAGADGAPITVDMSNEDGSFGVGPAILDGSATITAWTNIGGGLWSAPWPDDKQQARYPNDKDPKGQEKLSLWQDRVKVGLAQLPTPTRLDFHDRTADFAYATAMTQTSTTAKSWFEANFTDPSTLVGKVILLWDDGNVVKEADITGYDPATGTVTFVRPEGYDPYTFAHKMRFAIANHPECMKVPGQWYKDAATGDLVIRPFGDVDPTTSVIDYPSAVGGFAGVGTHYVHFKPGVVRGWAGTSAVLFKNATGCKVISGEVETNNNTYVVAFQNCSEPEIFETKIHDNNGRGVHAANCNHPLIAGIEAYRNSLSQISMYQNIRGFTIGCYVWDIIGVHANGITGSYQDGHETTVAFCTVRSEEKLCYTAQCTTGGQHSFGNDMARSDGGRIVQFHSASSNGRNEEGGHLFFCNSFMDPTNEGRAVLLMDGHLSNTQFFYNLVSGHEFPTDQRFNTDLTLSLVDFVSGGSGNRWADALASSGRYFYSLGGTPIEPGYIRMLTDLDHPPVGLEEITFSYGGRYPVGGLPADLVNVEWEQQPITEAGSTPVVLSTSSKRWAPLLVTANANSMPTRTGYNENTLEELGDIDLSANWETAFVNLTSSTGLYDIDVRPSGVVNFAQPDKVINLRSHNLLPNMPAQLTVSNIGPYKMDGSPIADWRAWLAA